MKNILKKLWQSKLLCFICDFSNIQKCSFKECLFIWVAPLTMFLPSCAFYRFFHSIFDLKSFNFPLKSFKSFCKKSFQFNIFLGLLYHLLTVLLTMNHKFWFKYHIWYKFLWKNPLIEWKYNYFHRFNAY